MSYDLQVITKRRPRTTDLTAFLSSRPDSLRCDGSLGPGAIVADDASGTVAEVDGPNRIESADVPDAAYGAIGRAGWLVEISGKPSSNVIWPRDLATHLARAADGVVYDPQEDAVTWPAGWRPRDRQTGAVPINQVDVTWFFKRPMDIERFAGRVVEVVGVHAPEALPQRYGSFEPLQHRFAGSDRAERFAAAWGAAAEDWISSLFWTGTRPCLGGFLSMSSLRKHPRDSSLATIRVSLTFDGRAFAHDPAFTERIVGCFTAVGGIAGCIYGAICVERGYTINRGRVTGTAMSETGPFPRADVWIGLPPSPTWMAWFGRPYAAASAPRRQRVHRTGRRVGNPRENGSGATGRRRAGRHLSSAPFTAACEASGRAREMAGRRHLQPRSWGTIAICRGDPALGRRHVMGFDGLTR